jgi:hypothetical protein
MTDDWTEAELQLTEEHSKRDLARLILRHEQRIAELETEHAEAHRLLGVARDLAERREAENKRLRDELKQLLVATETALERLDTLTQRLEARGGE